MVMSMLVLLLCCWGFSSAYDVQHPPAFPEVLPRTLTFIDHDYQGHRFAGLNIVIFGGTSGIGFASAAMFMQECAANVTVVSRNSKQGQLAAKVLQNISLAHCPIKGNVEFAHGDITKRGDVSRVFQDLRGQGQLHIVVNTAGVGGYSGNLAALPEDTLFTGHDALFNNGYGSTVVTQEALRFWDKADCNPLANVSCKSLGYFPSLVLFSSENGMMPCPTCEMYAASKHAIIGLTTSIAATFHGELRVNTILPTLIDTPLTWNQLRQYEQVNGTCQIKYPKLQTAWQCVINGEIIQDGDCPSGGTGYGCPCEDESPSNPCYNSTLPFKPVNPRTVGFALLDIADPTANSTGVSRVVDLTHEYDCEEGAKQPLWTTCPVSQERKMSLV